MSHSRTLDIILQTVTTQFLSEIDVLNPPEPQDLVQELYTRTLTEIELENVNRQKGSKLPTKNNITPSQLADILLLFHKICVINFVGDLSDSKKDVLAIYNDEGENKGVYTIDELQLRKLAMKYCYNLTNSEFKELQSMLGAKAERKTRTIDRDLIAVNNGVFNYRTKQLLPFNPDFIFMSKSKVDYVVNPPNPTITHPTDHTVWDVESWMNELSDDPQIVNSLWEILGAIIRPHVRWNKAAFLYSTVGNNGKGTLCELMRNLCGKGSYASIPLANFAERFSLEPLIKANAIIVDENDVGLYLDKVAKLKAVITNDTIDIDRKHEAIISFQYYGFMVQCLNELPQVRDQSDSFYRRQLFIPMAKNFEGIERRYIKDDYMHRKEVLEYVLHRVLHSDFYVLSTPNASTDLLNEYKRVNDPVRDFFEDMQDQFVWDSIPYDFIYSLYKAWYDKNVPSGRVTNSRQFKQRLNEVLFKHETWEVSKTRFRINANHQQPEPLITEYGLVEWQNPKYMGNASKLLQTAYFTKELYSGIKRKQ